MDLLCDEQRSLCGAAARGTLFSARLGRRLAVLKRHVIAVKRSEAPAAAAATAAADTAQDKTNEDEKPKASSSLKKQQPPRETPAQKATGGLAKLGSRAALSFAFAFLRRAWRSGADGDLCSDLLQDCLEALQTLPEASLFETEAVSTVWLEMVDRTGSFLRSVVTGKVLAAPGAMATGEEGAEEAEVVPAEDKHRALFLLLEFAVQKG